MQKKEVKVPSINFQTLLFEIQGKSPLLMNKPPMTLDSDQEKSPDPYEVAKRGVYFNENGNIAIPCIYFIKSMINAARFTEKSGILQRKRVFPLAPWIY